MTGLKYERFIVKLSLEQKLRLITSTEFYKTHNVSGYDFPTFEIRNQPLDDSHKDLKLTHFPRDIALASSWNPELIEDVYTAIGEEVRAENSFAYYNCTNGLTKGDVTTSNFVFSRFLAGKISGLKNGGSYINFEDAMTGVPDEDFARKNVRDSVFDTVHPDSLIISDVNEVDKLKKRYKYEDLVFGVVSNLEEALDFLYSGASFLFLENDIFDKLLNKLNDLTAAYKIAQRKYANNRMTESSFARLVRNFKVFDVGIIDRACNDVITILFNMKAGKDAPKGTYKALNGGRANFDEINHDALAVEAAKQTVIMMKNEGGVLPITTNIKVAVIGEYAKESKYLNSYYISYPTKQKTPFDAFAEYDFNTIGYALGYTKGEPGRSDLIDHAKALCDEADAAVVYLSVPVGRTDFPAEQLELLASIAGRKAKVIAVVTTEGNIDMGFMDQCDAVLLTYVGGQGAANAVLDIISGAVPPSGRLTTAAGHLTGETFTQKYPLGYGLSYAEFEYLNLKVNESGVSFTIKNVSENDGYAVPQLYVRKKNTQSMFINRMLRGFTKVFIAAGDAIRVKIPFDDITFRLYSPDKGYYVEGGLYSVSVCENADDEKLTGILLLKEYVEKNDFRNKVVDTSDDGKPIEFTERELPESVKAARKQVSFGLKLFLAIMLAVYANAVFLLFILSDIIADKGVVFYVIIAIVALLVNAVIVIYIVRSAKIRKGQKYIHKNDVLSNMLDNVGEFTEIAKVKFKSPVEEIKKPGSNEEEIVETAEESGEEASEEEPVTEEEEPINSYEVSFDEVSTEDVAYAEKVSFPDICTNMRDYVLGKGINLEMGSARTLVGAIAASKVVFLTSKSAELLPKFTEALNGYYGNDGVTEAGDEWHSPNELLWKQGEGRYVLSLFSNQLHSVYSAKDKQSVIIINNVNINNLGSYFCQFLDYANHPSEEHKIKFNDDISIILPDNVTYILVPQGGQIESLPTEILNGSIVADVMLTAAVEEEMPKEEVVPKVISHENFLLMLSEAKEHDFISEKIWKKIDSLAENINMSERFAIGNKNILQLERFSSVVMDCGIDEHDALTDVFLSKLVFILKNTKMYRQDGGEQATYSVIEKLFADEELSKIKRALTKTVKE